MKQKKSNSSRSKHHPKKHHAHAHSHHHKNNTVKKHGKQADLSQLRLQVDALGLKIIQVTADGNCFFRALADQLEGNEEEHAKYRNMVVQYIRDHREDFEPFIEDEVPFDDYCESMDKDGTWAGNMELQAASLITRRNICIHQANSPRWYISNFNDRESTMIHLSYHDGEHYNSVRMVDDVCEGPAKPITIKVDANISATDHNRKVTTTESKASSRRDLVDSGSVKLVMAGTGCANIDKVEKVLQEVGGDADAAIEFLIAEQENDADIEKCDDIPCESVGDDQNGNCETLEAISRNTVHEQNQHRSDFQSVHCHKENEKVATNRECSCGSKKCKACRSSTVGQSAIAPVIKNNRIARKGKKEIKRIKKKEVPRETQKCQSGIVPDVGALCI